MSKPIAAVNPFSTGPGGSRFELLVATFYLISMLRGEIPLGFEDGGRIVSVKLQQRNKGNPVDDVVIQTEKGLLSIQVKNSVKFTGNKPTKNGKPPEFYDALSQCWSLFNDSQFNREIDCFGIAFNEGNTPINTKTNLNDAINWAKTERTVESYLIQLNKFKEKKKYFEIFRDLLSDISKNSIADKTTWDFIRHLVILPFDFNQNSGHSFTELLNKLLEIVKSRSAENAEIMRSTLYCLATNYAINGGEIDSYSLEKQLPLEIYAPINNTLTSYTLQKNLASQLKNKINREINSKKYIPTVFTEIPDAKDELRIFSDPVLFIKKIVEDLQRIDFYLYNELATELGFPSIRIELPNTFKIPNTLSDAQIASHILKEYISGIISCLNNVEPYKGKKVSEFLNTSNSHLFDEVEHLLWGANLSLQWDLKRMVRHLDLITCQVLIIEGKAASGKTNFICNFAERTLQSRQQTSFYITGYDISNELSTTALKNYIINRFNEEYDGKISRLLSDIHKICLKDKKPVLIIIDGINEHSDLSHFAGELEQIIEEFTSTINIKFILTCRSENFEKRFSNLKKSSFADKVIVIQNFTNKIAPIHKKFMITAYFKHFKIYCQPNQSVINTFVNNPLILRLFCEGYGSDCDEDFVMIGPLNNIHLDVLFERYNQRISENFDKDYPDRNFKRKYKKMLNELAEYMFKYKTFSNVPVDSISTESYEIISILVNDGVILRKDLTENISITEDSEVINFTFDEFRDFILADYLIKKLARDDFDKFKTISSELMSPDCPVAEGLGNYTFMISRRNNDQKIFDHLKSLDNYDEIFLSTIFNLDDDAISHEDLEKIEYLFYKNSQSSKRIYLGLLNMRSKIDFPNLNIWVFLNLTSQLNKADYLRLVTPIFSSHEMMNRTCNSIRKILDGYDPKAIDLDPNNSLIEILICISPIPLGYPQETIFEILLKITNNHPKLIMSLITKYLEDPRSYVAQNLWTEIASSQSSIFFTKEIFDIAIKIRNISSINLDPEFYGSLDLYISTCEKNWF